MNKRLVVRMSPVQPLKTEVKPKLWARVVDISDRGAQIEAPCPLAPKSTFDLRFQLDGQELLVRATVKRCRVWRSDPAPEGNRTLLYRAGLEFLKPSPGLVELLSNTVALKPTG